METAMADSFRGKFYCEGKQGGIWDVVRFFCFVSCSHNSRNVDRLRNDPPAREQLQEQEEGEAMG